MKKTVLAAALMIAGLTAGVTASAQQYQTQIQIGTKWFGSYHSGEQVSHSFGNPTRIERLWISAEATCGQYSKVHVYVDGNHEIEFAVPRVDPAYEFPVRKIGSNIMLTFDGCVKLNDVRAYVGGEYSRPMISANLDTPAGLSETTLQVVAALQEHASDYAFDTYLKPIRKAAIRLAASDAARDPQSRKTGSRSDALIKAIDNAEGYLEQLSNRTYYVQAVQTLFLVKEKLEKMYDLP